MTIARQRVEVEGLCYMDFWEGLSSADLVGEETSRPGAPDRSVHVFGTFDGASVSIEGSNDLNRVDWQILHDVGGVLLTFTTSEIRAIAENVIYMRPVLSGGTSPSVNVNILSRQAR